MLILEEPKSYEAKRTNLGCHLWYEQFKMCSLVTGGKGNSLYPTSTGAEAVSSLVASCVVMVAGLNVTNDE